MYLHIYVLYSVAMMLLSNKLIEILFCFLNFKSVPLPRENLCIREY